MTILEQVQAAQAENGIYNSMLGKGGSASGANDWSVINGKLYDYQGTAPAEVKDAYPSATQQEISQIKDPRGPGSGESPLAGIPPIFKMAAAMTAMYFGGPMAAALVNGVTTLASGGSILSSLASSGLSFITQGVGADIGIDLGTTDLGIGQATGSAAGESLASSGMDISGGLDNPSGLLDSQAGDAMQYTADAGVNGDSGQVNVTTVQDSPNGLLDSPVKDYSAYTGGTPTDTPNPLSDQTIRPDVGDTANSGTTGTGNSTVDGVLKFINDNKALSSGIGMVAGGIGKGLLDSSTASNKIAADERMLQTKIAADQALLDKKNQNTMELEDWRRKFGTTGQMPGNVPVQAPNQTRTVTRPGGAPVYNAAGLLTPP